MCPPRAMRYPALTADQNTVWSMGRPLSAFFCISGEGRDGGHGRLKTIEKARSDELTGLDFGGSPARTRTTDTVVNSHLLCRLSYWGAINFLTRIYKASAAACQ